MVKLSNLNISSARVLTNVWVAVLVLFASVSFADPVIYTDANFPESNIAIGADGVEFQLSGAKPYDYTMSGSGSLYKTGAGTLTLNKNGSTFTGDVHLDGGKIKVTVAWTGEKSALGAVQSGRTINVNSGAELTLNNQDIFTNAHNANPILFVVDGGAISNDGAYYNYLTNVTLKNGAQIKATNGNDKWKAYKLHNLNVERSDRADRSPATITALAGQTNATIAFGDISNTIKAGNSSSTINVGEITSADGSVDDKSDLIISAVIANPLYDSKPYSKATQIVKTGAGTMELTAANTITGKTTINAGKIKLSGSGTLGTGAVVNNATLEFAHTSNQTSSNLISGTGSVIKIGSGTLTLSNINSSFTGDFIIDAGAVKVTGGSNEDNRTASALGASNVEGRTVTINSGAVLELAAQDVMCDTHADTKLLFVVDGGKITNSGANFNFIQNVTLKNGANMHAANGNTSWEAYKIQNLRVERSGDAAASAVSLTGANNDHAVFSFGAISNNITTVPVSIYVEDITSANGVSDAATDLLISAKVVDANIDGKTKKPAPMVKSGAGTLELKNAGNTYSGNLTIDEGTVKVTAGSASNGRTASALGAGNVTGRLVTVNEGAVLDLTVDNVIVNAHTDTKLAIVVDGGQIINSGYNYLQNLTLKDGAQVYAANGAEVWKSYKFHNLNVVRKSADAADSPVTISSDLSKPYATIAFGAKSDTIKVGDNNSISTVTVEEITSADPSVNDNVSDLVISAVIANPLHTTSGALSNATQIVKAGAGTMELTAANTITGKTTISEGSIKLTGNGTLGTGAVTINENGTLEIAYEDASKSVNFSSVSMTEDDVFHEGSSFKVTSGKVTFGTADAALNNLSGGYLDENGQAPNPVPATLTVAGNLTLNNDQLTKYIGSITADTIQKTGDGTLQIYTGAEGLVSAESLVVSSGRLDLKGYMAGSITIEDAVFSPGNSIGEATFDDDFILGSAASMLLMEIGGENPSQNDSLIAGGDITLNDGLIYLTLSDDSALKGGDTFTAVLSGSNSGNAGFADDLLSHVQSYYFTDLEYIQLDNSYGEKYNGKFAIRGRLDPNAVPEPSTWALLALGVVVLFLRKRK